MLQPAIARAPCAMRVTNSGTLNTYAWLMAWYAASLPSSHRVVVMGAYHCRGMREGERRVLKH